MRKLMKILKMLFIFSFIIIAILTAFIVVGDKSEVVFLDLAKKFSFNDDEYTSKYIYVLNREDKSMEFEKGSKTRAFPASLTKVMTTIVAIEHIDDLSEIAPVDVDTYKKMVEKNASMAGFYGKESTTYRDLLYGTILSSGGEAANSLAINISGNVEDFVLLMNEKASELGLNDTHFTNPEGLHDKNQYTTAYDMALLLDYALDNGHFKAIFTKNEFNTISTLDHPSGIMLKSTVLSKLDNISQEGFEIIGGKSGTTSEAGECWATLGMKQNEEYICIVMGAPLEDISNPNGAQIDDTIEIFKRIE